MDMDILVTKFIYYHVVLPPKLPQGDDTNPRHELALLQFVLGSLNLFQAIPGFAGQEVVQTVSNMIRNGIAVREDAGTINENQLVTALQALVAEGLSQSSPVKRLQLTNGKGGAVPLLVKAQNAAIIISHADGEIHFEPFELSPPNEVVIETRGRLKRSFPSDHVVVGVDQLRDENFVRMIARTFSRLSFQDMHEMQPKVRKAGQEHDETRDTTKPFLITSLMMHTLAAVGRVEQVRAVEKNCREEVLWHKSYGPWRRSPTWLYIRVVLQTTFARASTSSGGQMYKAFMIFFLSQLLETCCSLNMESEYIFALRCKIAQRLLKFESQDLAPWIERVRHVLDKAGVLLQKSWDDTIFSTSQHLDLPLVGGSDVLRHTVMELPRLESFLQSVHERKALKRTVQISTPGVYLEYDHDKMPTKLALSVEAHRLFALAAFERWVGSHMPTWLANHIAEHATPGTICRSMELYYDVASIAYSNAPEMFSVMLLTVMELWVACDQSACAVHAILKDYRPEIPSHLLQSLVFPYRGQMKRLHAIELYLGERNAAAKLPSAVTSAFGSVTSFAVRLFNGSADHQALKQQIEEDAHVAREQKRAEFRREKARHDQLMNAYDNGTCEEETVLVDALNDFYEHRHPASCRRCKKKKTAKSLQIDVHEWPLPEGNGSKAAVFELLVPQAFNGWRDATLFVLRDVLKSELSTVKHPEFSHAIEYYTGLSRYYTDTAIGSQRVTALSEAKPHTSSHRKSKAISTATEDTVLVNNGLHLRYYDKRAGVFLSSFCTTETICERFIYQLSNESSSLQQFLARPPSRPNGPPPNEVIASQSECPPHLSLDEYKAFATLPLGIEIQWTNLLTQLAVPIVNFSRYDTRALILQILYQTGPPSDYVERSGHEIVLNARFCTKMLEQLSSALQKVEENWDSSNAWTTFALIAARILSLTNSEEIEQLSLSFLAKVRTTAMKWMESLLKKAMKASSNEQRSQFITSAVEAALTSILTFDLDQQHCDRIFVRQDLAAVFLRASIIIQENATFSVPKHSSMLVTRWKRLCYRSLPLITAQIVDYGDDCLDTAVKQSWASYQPGIGWTRVNCPQSPWLTTRTGEPSGQTSIVHFNVLSAELLVDGLPLSRLPRKYEQHAVYATLFGTAVVEVMPSQVAGLSFSAKAPHEGWDIHFGMQGNSPIDKSSKDDLLIHARQNGSEYDLVPPSVFSRHLPAAFVTDFVHWYDHTANAVEFRSTSNPWSSSTSWTLRKAATGWTLSHGNEFLIDPSSQTGQAGAQAFTPVEYNQHVHIMFNTKNGMIKIDLPRLRLDFHVKPKSSVIISRQFNDMCIDSQVGIGTLVGLESKIILRHVENNSQRVILVPDGQLSCRQTGRHRVTTIARSGVASVHAYKIDTLLGCLTDNGDLRSKLFLCLLHAVTSHCLPDQLTGLTGTEQALTILRSAAVKSFDRLSEANMELLASIADLSPARNYYPQGLRVMQTVTWNPDLSFFCQHGWFRKIVEKLFEDARLRKIFHPTSQADPPKLRQSQTHLLERELIRSHTFHMSHFGAESFTDNHDTRYDLRAGLDNDRSVRVFEIATTIFEQRQTAPGLVSGGVSSEIKRWFMSQASIPGVGSFLDSSEFHFDCRWLNEPTQLLRSLWCRIHLSFSRRIAWYDRYSVMMWLCSLAFSLPSDTGLPYMLAALYNTPALTSIEVPHASEFRLGEGTSVNQSIVAMMARNARKRFKDCPEGRHSGGDYHTQRRRQSEFQGNQDRAINRFASHLASLWPLRCPPSPTDTDIVTYINVPSAMNSVKSKFLTWHDNHNFSTYLDQIVAALASQPMASIGKLLRPALILEPCIRHPRKGGYVRVEELFSFHPPAMPQTRQDIQKILQARKTEVPTTCRSRSVLDTLKRGSSSKPKLKYISDLQESLRSYLASAPTIDLACKVDDPVASLMAHRSECERKVSAFLEAIISAIVDSCGAVERIALSAGQWPRMTTLMFLSQLNRLSWSYLNDGWKANVVNFALAHTEVQHAIRLLRAARNPSQLSQELSNTGHENWDPHEFPEWLLLEVESGISIRAVQREVASRMCDPPGGKNVVMQLHMGEGKSSVIIPIVAIKLADGTVLVRVVVAKPQSKQMARMLISKLGGLLGRRIYRMPFSRALRLTDTQLDEINRMCKSCMANGGILLIQPEHILSLQLMGPERIASRQEALGSSLLRIQRFFNENSRDLVDESDEVFNVKFELVYTMGVQAPVDFAPERWVIAHAVLQAAARAAHVTQKQFPSSIRISEYRGREFPVVQFSDFDAIAAFLDQVATDICNKGLPGFPVAHQTDIIKDLVQRYIRETSIPTEVVRAIEQGPGKGFWERSIRKTLLLLRGLIAGGVLRFALGSKRWRVAYGLDSTRSPPTRLAVPYRAKDSPSPRSEFSHPDVVILLTSLSYYYGGLSDAELFLALEELLASDEPQMEYAEWVRGRPDCPDTFRYIDSINIKDHHQCTTVLFPLLRFSKPTIDYYLQTIVFPKEMREFPKKMSASGWDLGRVKRHPTTGFSGTNDTHPLLPLAVQQLDVETQRHTNAMAIEYLLRPENAVEFLSQRDVNESDAAHLLKMVTKLEPNVKVIIDVGAQILELNNREVAEMWLSMVADEPGHQAVVFFGDEDDVLVLDRSGHVELLHVSPFLDRLGACLVYLDEVHTRGTDLQLPHDYRAAVTLSPNLTKDRMVQACMRMRKLGKGQSVVFCIPVDVKEKMAAQLNRNCSETLCVEHVLDWTISQTCEDLQRSMPLWATQGLRFERHERQWIAGSEDGTLVFSVADANTFLEDEAQSVERRYQPYLTRQRLDSGAEIKGSTIESIMARYQDYECNSIDSGSLEEEQERELSPEIEEERQVQLPPRLSPHAHNLHPDIVHFARYGQKPPQSAAFLPAFETLRSSSAGALFDVSQFSSDLLVTADFARTVRVPAKANLLDGFFRPVQYVLTTTEGADSSIKILVIISPFEAQELLKVIKRYNMVTLHLYSARFSLELPTLDSLDFFIQGKEYSSDHLPRHLIILLNLYSGQIYLRSYEEYQAICKYLGLAHQRALEGSVVGSDGFLGPYLGEAGFAESPVESLKTLIMVIRRNCRPIGKSHMGKILSGQLLLEADMSDPRA